MKPYLILASALALGWAGATPQQAPSSSSALTYRSGTISLLGGKATLTTGTTLRYLDAQGARRVITELWGNPPGSADDVLGMIVPAGIDPDTERGWGVVLTESLDGHVKDDDAAKTDYAKMLRDLQRSTGSDNSEREKAGYGTIDLIGWADSPRYDAATHKMYWAKELAFHDKGESQAPSEHTLNYAVRVLGRDSVLELNAVAGMAQLAQVRRDMGGVLQQVSFTPGHRYEDYRAGTDKLATYGVAALVGGVVAKKAGLLAVGLLLLKKGWIVLLALMGGLGRLFRRREA
ncbi:DUF2167 domain-containing protein [Deinococcus koreensis]|uniref:DUF2167 domain-containing protein n=1 Tax=Deinococcus koreensis TaxID=2054903 RepID=A0A2K3V1D9_9DEIO|nr:DUF2167 domain-containing protein [Deinococcus koreensis]PNY82606.1 DUF2167 domain-containing protein [Deinococcus koreensis]